MPEYVALCPVNSVGKIAEKETKVAINVREGRFEK